MKLLAPIAIAAIGLLCSGCRFYGPESNAHLDGTDVDFRRLVDQRSPLIHPGMSKGDVRQAMSPAVGQEFNQGRHLLYTYVTTKGFEWPLIHPFLSSAEVYRTRYLLLWFDDNDRLKKSQVLAESYFDMGDDVEPALSDFRLGKLVPGSIYERTFSD